MGLQSRKTDIIAVIVPDLANTTCNTFVKYLEKQAQGERDLVTRFVAKDVDTFVILPSHYNEVEVYQGIVSVVHQRQVPMVFVGPSVPDIQASSVTCDIERGQYELTCSLIQKGLRRLVFLRILSMWMSTPWRKRQAEVTERTRYEPSPMIFPCVHSSPRMSKGS